MGKSPIKKAFDKINKLNLPITLDKIRELNKILFDLANESYREGSDMAVKIFI